MDNFLSFKTTFQATLQIFLLGALGFLLLKKRFLSEDGLNLLSRLVIEIALPVLIFCQLIERFSFSLYPKWWIFPVLSLIITASGFLLGSLLLFFYKAMNFKKEFISLVAFQNSGYLPLILIATILPVYLRDVMFNYLFLFLLGFNLVIWSFGVWYLTNSCVDKNAKGSSLNIGCLKDFEFVSLFSPPVVAILASLLLIAFGFNQFIPQLVLKPLKMIGECTLPLAMLVVGGNLAAIKIFKPDKIAVTLLVIAKLLILPALALLFLKYFRVDSLLGMLILLQAAMPSATSLSLISRRYKLKEEFINQAVFITHIVSLITIPLLLGFYGRLISLPY